MTESHLDDLDVIMKAYGARTFAFHMCPPLVFAEIVKINDLRLRGTNDEMLRRADLAQEAYGILHRMNAFVPEEWADSKPSSKEAWVLVGTIYKVAVVLYCINSLQSVSVLPLDSSLRECCSVSGVYLRELLSDALSRPGIPRSLVWPLVVLGAEAVHSGIWMRAFVQTHLEYLSRSIGTRVPLMAKEVLEKFWASGETRWDFCFDTPNCFVANLAIDIGALFDKRQTVPSDSDSIETIEIQR